MALKNNGIKKIKTVEEAMFAIDLVKLAEDGLLLEDIHEQTPEHCMTAVANNHDALVYVKDREVRKLLNKLIGSPHAE